jgi:PAS domain S-box-containing protein
VLHVDDPAVADAAATRLERTADCLGVVTATTAAEARASLSGVDCVVAAYDLPDESGLSLLESVRETHPDLPFILFPGEGSEELASDAISAGVTDYVRRDDDGYDELAGSIWRAVAARREQQRASAGTQRGAAGGHAHDWKNRHRELDLKTQAMDEAPVGIVVTDFTQPDNPIIYANAQFEAMTGYSEPEILGRNCRFLQGADTDPEAVTQVREAVDAGESVTVELTNYRKDGTAFWNRLSIAPLREADEVTAFVGFQTDVTERKSRERELRREQAFLEQSIDTLDDLFYAFSPEGNLLRWNGRVVEVSGYTDTELESMGPTEFFPEEQRDRIAAAVQAVFEDGNVNVEADYLTADGERIPHEFTGRRLTGPDGELLGFVGIGRDISQQRANQHQLRRRTERLAEFASIVSHDLRNPLNVAEGHLQLAREDRNDDHLDAVAEAHDRMGNLIEDLLELADEGAVAFDPEPISLATAVETCWQTVATEDATVTVADDATIRADESRLRQLLENLVRNAVDHGPADVALTVGPLADDEGFYLADDGPGIPDETKGRVFESGFTTGGSGIGKGLSIVQRVAKAHNWTVEVTDSDSGGARFEIRTETG